MRQTKSCGCLIGTGVINLEKERRKNMLKIQEINKKLKTVKDSKKITKLKAEKRELLKAHKEASIHKKNMKKRFDEHIKKSGYVPPKFK